MNTNDETIKEILMVEEQEIKNGGKKKKSCFARFLIFLIILMIAFLGLVFLQQYLLDIEAEAIVRAARTSTALAGPSDNKEMPIQTSEGPEQSEPTATTIPLPTPTEDSAFEHTATIAVQLTEVAEFQLTATVEP